VMWTLVIAWYSGTSVLTFVMYALDKRRAQRGQWRVSEARLHVLELLGGWPGGLAARRVLRHKARKWKFLVVSWVIVAAHVAAWMVWWMWWW
jgi:uncharacterized membrane protein YsdA (DUF1294 family)